MDRIMMRVTMGKGCAHCEHGHPVEKLEGSWGDRQIKLCLECVLAWFPGKDVTWWEDHHAPMADHVADAITAAHEREYEQLMASVGKKGVVAFG